MPPYPGGKHGPGHYMGAVGFQGQFVQRGLGTLTIQQAGGIALEADMPVHVTGDLLVVGVTSQGTNYTVAGWFPRMTLTTGGRIGFFWKIATSAAETFLIPINVDLEAGRFAQCVSYDTPSDAVEAAAQTTQNDSNPDDGIFSRAGAPAEAFTDTLLLLTGHKVGANYDPDPAGAQNVGSLAPWTKLGFAAVPEWEPGAKRFDGFYFGELFEGNANLIANGTVVQIPALWTQGFDSVGVGTKTLRFRIP